MIAVLIEPFAYAYMIKAILACTVVGMLCAFLSCYLIMKGWSLMGDGLAHSVVPGVALAYLLSLPFSAGAFFAGMMAAFGMLIIRRITKLRQDAIIGLIFTSFFAIGLLLASAYPVSINIQAVFLGNILAISDNDLLQVGAISAVGLAVLIIKWKDFMLLFFDEVHARSIGIHSVMLQTVFFMLLSACAIVALQTVGAALVIAMLVTPGATAYLLCNRFSHVISLSLAFSGICSAIGAYASFFLDMHPGGLIVVLQTFLFILAFLFSPKHGVLNRKQTQHG